MLLKTHLVIALMAILLLFESVTYKFVFVVITLVATVLPDIDSGFSTLGKHALFKPVQFLTKHRGVIHSLTFCFLVSLVLALYFPIFSLPFFLGYGIHLFADAFSVEGIRPFWPLSFEAKGSLRVGGAIEEVLFVGFCIVDVVLFIGLFIA